MDQQPFKFVPDTISHETVEALEYLLGEARRGHIIGIGFVAMYHHREYIVNTAGECSRNPTFTRGMVCALDDKLGQHAGTS